MVSNTHSEGDIGQRNQAQGLLTLGHSLSEALTLGVTLSSGSTSLHNRDISAQTAYGLGMWGEYREHGVVRTGLQVSGGLGVNTQDNDLTRGKDLSNVQQLRGSSDMQTVAGRIGVGYGFEHPSGWLITPGVSVIQQHTALNAYSENQGAITGDYKKSRLNLTMADLNLTGQQAINGVSRVTLGAGIEYDLNVDRMHLKGVTDVSDLGVVSAESQLDRNSVRPYVSMSYRYDFPIGTVSPGVRVATDTFSNEPQAAYSISYAVRF